MSLNILDKKIIYELGINAHLTYKELAHLTNSKKTVIAYHFENLHKNEIIWKFVPVFSINRLGFYGYKIYLKFQGLDKKEKEALLKDTIEDPLINWVAQTAGSWDLLLAMYVYNPLEFAERKNLFFKKYGQYIQEYSVSFIEDALVFNRDYLLNKKVDYRREFVFGGKAAIEHIDQNQKDIIERIRNNGRYQITDLAKRLNLNVRTIISKIKDLEQRKIIQGYTTFLDINKIGLKFFKLCIYLQDFSTEKYNSLINFARFNQHVIHLIKAIGDWELELEMEAENVEYIYNFIEQIKTKFPHTIKKIDLIIITKEHKLEFFPQWH